MIGKAGLVAVVAVFAVVAGGSVHPRTLYNQMYPVNSLKRHAFNLCHESDPTFIRALHEDRAACYERMPYSISVALGFVRPTSELAAFFSPSGRVPGGGSLLPDAGFGGWAAVAQQPLLDSRSRADYRRAARAGSIPCPLMPAGSADLAAASTGEAGLDTVAGRRDALDAAALAELGLSPRGGNVTPLPTPGAAPKPVAGNDANTPQGLVLLHAADPSDRDTAPPMPPPTTGCPARI